MFLDSGQNIETEIAEARWLFLFGFVLVTAMIYWALTRLKKITLVGEEFIISNYRNEIRVNKRDVERVSGSVFLSPELAWLHFRVMTEFGSSVQFMPPVRFSINPFNRHPIVAELNSLVGDKSGT